MQVRRSVKSDEPKKLRVFASAGVSPKRSMADSRKPDPRFLLLRGSILLTTLHLALSVSRKTRQHVVIDSG